MALDGTYKITASSHMGKTDAILHDGSTLTGTNEVMGQTLQILDGKITGNAFEFKEKMESSMGSMEFSFSGTVDGDKITGAFKSQMGTTPFEGTRVG